ncbi:Ig-like domain-containing protein [Winogradskyella sp. Asnod2-B02-A]|uniref:Ig-like domain-containing protein n=1 Tax=Winogradskyella sp. Asnod2-B02-A TaxID=3160583 RepID=UPI00386440BF
MKFLKITQRLFGYIPLIILLLSFCNISAQQLAFPTAKGAGAYATGGRGGQVIHVTTLDWEGPGSLKEAIQTEGPRTIVFDVSGEIDASTQGNYEYVIDGRTGNYDNLTIAGQTAPEGGITVKTSWFGFGNVNNFIIRHIRFRRTTSTLPFVASAAWFRGCSNFIVDHATFSHGLSQKALDLSASDGTSGSITIQSSFFQDSSNGMIMGTDTREENPPLEDLGNFTLVDNVFSGISHRFPNCQGNGQYDIINNVIYNWKNRLARFTQDGTYNVINNYYKASVNGLRKSGWFGTTPITNLNKVQVINPSDTPLIYASGSIITGQRDLPQDDDRDMFQYFDGSDPQYPLNTQVGDQFFTTTQFPLNGQTFDIKTGQQAYLEVLADVGANKTLNANGSASFYQDNKDASDILMIQNDTYSGSFYDSVQSIPHPVVPENTRPQDFYVSSLHIPESWFLANVPNGEDYNDVAPSGYTWIEEYHNQVDGEIIPVNRPVITRTDTNPTTIEVGGTYIPPTGTYTDVEDGNGNATLTGDVDVNTIGSYIITLEHTDSDNNRGFLNIVINIIALQVDGVDATVTPETAQVQENNTVQLTATVNGTSGNATDQTGTWSSSNGNVTVDANGLVTGVNVGSAIVTFTSTDGGYTDTSSITINANQSPTAISFIDGEVANPNYFLVNENIVNPSATLTTTSNEVGATFTYSIPEFNLDDYERFSIIGDQLILDLTPDYENPLDTASNNIYALNVVTTSNTGGSFTQFMLFWVQDVVDESAIVVESVEVTPNITELQIIDTLQLTTTFTPLDATNQNGVWASSDDSIATVDTSGIVTPNALGVVTITFTTADGGFTDTSEITVLPEALQASAGTDQQICEGEITSLTASGGTNYVWSTGETTETIEVNPAITTTYTVTVSDDNGQSEDVTVTVTVNTVPLANAGEDQNICEGESISLIASGGDTYLWNTGETTASIEVNPIIETTYSVEVITNNCSSTDEVTIFVDELPSISITEDIVIVEGESTTLTALGSDNYEWSTSEITESITVTPTVTTTYTVSTVNANGCSNIASVIVTVIPEIIANAGEDVTICSGEAITLTAQGGSSYTWNTGDSESELNVSPTVTTTYTVTAVDDYGYTDTDEVTIFVNELPNITVSDDVFIMIGTEATLTADGGISYLWSTGETANEILVSPDVTTSYSVVGIGENGCESTKEVLVTVIAVLSANAGEDVSICLGESVTLNASGGVTYTWNTGDTGTSPTFNPSETTTYTVTVTDGFGNSDSDDVTIIVNPVPIANAGDDQTTCQNEPVVLTAEGGDSYLWSTGETTASITVNPLEDTTYNVEVFTNACSDSDAVNVFVLPTPDITVSDDIVIMLGDSATLLVSGGDSYLWSNGEMENSILVNPAETTTYTVTGFIENGCENTAQVTVTVVPEVIASAGNDVSICFGENVTLNASGQGDFSWNTGDVGTSPTFSPTETTTYTVTATDNFGNSDSDSVTVTVNELPNLTVSDNITIFEGESTHLIADGAETYFWNTGETSNSIIVSPIGTTSYSVTGFSASDCEVTKDVIVTVIPEVIANAGNDIDICAGESVTLNASGGANYSWNTGGTSASITLSPTVTTTYTVTVSDDFGNSDSDSVTVTVNELPNLTVSDNITIFEGESTNLIADGAVTYLWNTGETSGSIDVSPAETTNYSVTGFSTNGCQNTNVVTVTVIPLVVANAGNDVSICIGESVTLNASGSTNYSWSTGETSASITLTPTVTSTYTVVVSDDFGNSDLDSVTVTVNELPNLTVSENVTIYEGESTNLSADGAVTYLWNTGDTLGSINVSPTETTNYSVTGFSANGCQNTDEVTVTVIPEVVANAGNDVAICVGESVTLNASGGVNYIWNTGGTGASPTFTPTTTTTYTVTVSDNYGNSDTDSVTVTVNELPIITVSENITIIEGESISLVVNGATSYLWNTGETSNSIVVSPTQTTIYSVEGFTNSCSSAEAEVIVTVIPLFVASAGTDEYVCDNQTYEVVLTASQGDNYLWSTGETTQNITVSPLSTTSYTVTVTSDGQEDADDVTVYVNPSPVVTVANGESVEILNGDFITLSASGANTYEWNNGATQPNIAVSPSVTTTYEVKGYIGDCYDEKQVVVNVLPPVMADAGENVSICLNEVTTLTATGGDEYVWSTGETTSSIEVSPSQTTEYTVTVFNALDFGEASVQVEVDLNCTDQVSNPTGIPKDFDFNVYPNPATDIVNVKFSGVLVVSDVHIYDVTGKLIQRTQISNENISTSATIQVDISLLQSGVYFVKFIGEETDIIKKIIVQ